MPHDQRGRVTVDTAGKWRLYWGNAPLPTGAEGIGVVQTANDGGALIRLLSGTYVQGNYGGIKTLPQDKVAAAIRAAGA